MKILRAIRFKGGNAVLGIDSNGNTINASVYNGLENIEINRGIRSSFELYEKDTESYESISIHSFNRMLRLASYRINKHIE